MRSWPHRIVIIGAKTGGDAQLAFHAFNKVCDDIVVMDFAEDTVDKAIKAEPDLIFIVLPEGSLSTSATGLLKDRVPSEALEILWQLNEESPQIPVHVGVPNKYLISDPPQFTALDTLALALSGACGIWEVSSIMFADTAETVFPLSDIQFAQRTGRTFLFGQPLSQLDNFYQRVSGGEWPCLKETEGGEEESLESAKVFRCFELALGVAGLASDKLAPDSGTKTTIDFLSGRLVQLRDSVGCYLSKPMLSKLVGHLDNGWKDRIKVYDRNSRDEMPLWARLEGFPQNIPLIKGYSAAQSGKVLYEALESLSFERYWEPNSGLQYTTVSIKIEQQRSS